MSETEKQIVLIILDHIEVCRQRFESIVKADDFIYLPDGGLKLDAISMRLQAIAENVKRIVKMQPSLQQKYPEINWDDIIRFRNFISHHYELLDHEIVFHICNVHLPLLKSALQKEIE